MNKNKDNLPIFLEEFVKDLGKLYALTSTQQKLLYILISIFTTNEIVITQNKKTFICNKLSITEPSFKNIMSTLYKKSLLLRNKRGSYSINSELIPLNHDKVVLYIQYKKIIKNTEECFDKKIGVLNEFN